MEITTAAGAYRAARERVDRQISRIETLLHEHANKATAKPGDYGFTGDLAHVAEVLDDAIEFLGGTREQP